MEILTTHVVTHTKTPLNISESFILKNQMTTSRESFCFYLRQDDAGNKYRDNGVNIDLVVSRILRKVSQGDDVIYVFEIVSNMIGEKL